SKVKVNGRPIFGKSQEDRPRYASFLATTNDEHPLCDPTGSRRFICIRIPAGKYIDNGSPITYDQLYAQVMYELRHQHTPYWFTNDEVARIQQHNYPFFKTDDMESMLKCCFQAPGQDTDGKWLIINEIFKTLQKEYPMIVDDHRTKIRIGQAMKFLNCERKRTKKGPAYLLCPKRAA
ncbi:MAG TPA: helicase, partial [Prevotella sp.]|nr:helicase [Candidatus Segatella violae]